MNIDNKDIITVLVIALIGTIVVLRFTDDSKSESIQDANDPKQEAGIAVEVIQPSMQTINEQIPYLGTVAGTKDGQLSFRMGGTLETIKVREGEKVQQGQLLATISVPELDAQIKRAQSEFEKTQSSKTFWEREASTDSTLYEEGAISQTVFNKTTFNYEQALKSYHAARAALEEVQERKFQTRLKAPAQGTVGSVLIREGSNVSPNQAVFFFHQGKPIIYADVLEQDIQKGISIGTPVTATFNSGENINGKVERIDYRATLPFRSVRVFADFGDTLLSDRPSGAGASLMFDIATQEEALMVPASAIDLRTGSPRLLRVNDKNEVESVPVTLGIQKNELQHIIGAVSESDLIIIAGINNVDPGDKVQIMNGNIDN